MTTTNSVRTRVSGAPWHSSHQAGWGPPQKLHPPRRFWRFRGRVKLAGGVIKPQSWDTESPALSHHRTGASAMKPLTVHLQWRFRLFYRFPNDDPAMHIRVHTRVA